MGGRLQVIASLVRKEFFLIRQDKRMLMLSFITPIVQVLLLGYAATTDIHGSRIVVADLDRTAESRDFIRRFSSTEYFIHAYTVDRYDDADDYLVTGKASAAVMIPPGFGNRLAAGTPAPLEIIFDGTDANTASILLGYATQIVNSFSQEIRPALRVLPAAGVPGAIVPQPRVWFNPDLKSQYFMVPGVVALVLMIITMTLTALGIVKEKEMGTLEQLMVAPIKPYQLILGKLIPFVVIGFFSMSLILTVARLWFEIPMRGHFFTLYALSGLFILTTLGLGLFISTLARSQQQAMLIAQFFFFMPFTFLGGFAFPISNMPEVIQWLTYLIPLRYFMEILRGVFLKGAGLRELWFQAGMLLLFGGAIFTLSVIRFRRRLG